jgi:transcriptional antiterminator RfaH
VEDESQLQEMGDPGIVLSVLILIERGSAITQRRLAGELGIAFGLANAYLRLCVRKGLVKMRQVPITPWARRLRRPAPGVRGARLAGDLAEIAVLSAGETRIDVLCVIDSALGGRVLRRPADRRRHRRRGRRRLPTPRRDHPDRYQSAAGEFRVAVVDRSAKRPLGARYRRPESPAHFSGFGELGRRSIVMRRCAVHTRPNAETIALDHLLQQGYAAYLPRIWVSYARRGQAVLRPLFPRYLFADFESAAMRCRPILSTIGVAGVVRSGNQPTPVSPEIVDEIRRCEHFGMFDRLDPRRSLRLGELVRVTAGAFEDMVGRLLKLRDQDRVVVLLDLLGRAVRVDLRSEAVEAA